jgi:hypothetical protein
MKYQMLITAAIVAAVSVPLTAKAQGVPGGFAHGAEEGFRVAGPIGAVVGAPIGAVVGGIEGVLGITPSYAQPQVVHHRVVHRSSRKHRRAQYVQ